jgi:hypothetical protein
MINQLNKFILFQYLGYSILFMDSLHLPSSRNRDFSSLSGVGGWQLYFNVGVTNYCHLGAEDFKSPTSTGLADTF